jgi:hypothetical protein
LKYSKYIFPALLALVLSACASGKFKAPRCHGTYEPVNAPERYLKGNEHE